MKFQTKLIATYILLASSSYSLAENADGGHDAAALSTTNDYVDNSITQEVRNHTPNGNRPNVFSIVESHEVEHFRNTELDLIASDGIQWGRNGQGT